MLLSEAPAAVFPLIRCYLTYWNQRVAVIFIGVDGVVVTVAADGLPLESGLGEAGVDPGVVGVDGAQAAPPAPWHEVSEGRVLAYVGLLLPAGHVGHVSRTWLAAQGPRDGVIVRVRELPVNIVPTCGQETSDIRNARAGTRDT